MWTSPYVIPLIHLYDIPIYYQLAPSMVASWMVGVVHSW